MLKFPERPQIVSPGKPCPTQMPWGGGTFRSKYNKCLRVAHFDFCLFLSEKFGIWVKIFLFVSIAFPIWIPPITCILQCFLLNRFYSIDLHSFKWHFKFSLVENIFLVLLKTFSSTHSSLKKNCLISKQLAIFLFCCLFLLLLHYS